MTCSAVEESILYSSSLSPKSWSKPLSSANGPLQLSTFGFHFPSALFCSLPHAAKLIFPKRWSYHVAVPTKSSRPPASTRSTLAFSLFCTNGVPLAISARSFFVVGDCPVHCTMLTTSLISTCKVPVAPSPYVVTKKVFPDMARCLLGNKITPVENLCCKVLSSVLE